MKRYAVTFMVEIDDRQDFNTDPSEWIFESIQNQLSIEHNENVIDFICEEIEEK